MDNAVSIISFPNQVEVKVPQSNILQGAADHVTSNDEFEPKVPGTVDPQIKILVDQLCSGYEGMSDSSAECKYLPQCTSKRIDKGFPKEPEVSNSLLEASVNYDPMQDSSLTEFEAQTAGTIRTNKFSTGASVI
ncbi:hypothetical protein QAD02_011638 [Eretmocerus hayati]|uniref:Uncharacterized protein n=1 Tax=Eretmocerus hayati TaxID=131215 RepID=A0ACC2P070_9HYME|nr:hypothetical protein QAD02_011638 [Eretmocerus hayati]